MVVPFLMLAAVATGSITCEPPKSAQTLVSRASLRWLILGEDGHGTEEMPRTVADFVCAAARARRPVTVGVEFGFRNQPALDSFMASDGKESARAALLAAPMWDPDWADGKSSQAMFVLLEWLRLQHRRGVVVNIIAFDPDIIRSGADREQQMAQRLRAMAPIGRGLFIALTGSYHARIRMSDPETTPYPPMATLLPRTQTFGIRLQGSGGRNWSCTESGCGEQDAGQTGGLIRQLSLCPTAEDSYDGEYNLGVPVTPSPPMKRKTGARLSIGT